MIDEKFFPLRLSKLRSNKGVSARDMSLTIGQNPGYINNIETGKSMPSLMGVYYICEYLGITPAQFFDEGVSNPTRVGEITEKIKKLDDKQLDIILALVNDMIK